MTTGYTCYRCGGNYGVLLKTNPKWNPERAAQFQACLEKRCLPLRWLLNDHARWLERHAGSEMDLVIEAIDALEMRFRLQHPGWRIADTEDGRQP